MAGKAVTVLLRTLKLIMSKPKGEHWPPHFWVCHCGPTSLPKHPFSLSGSERMTQAGTMALWVKLPALSRKTRTNVVEGENCLPRAC